MTPAGPDGPARRRILSIDGGGIRGIIPLCALAALERTTGRPARETFSFVAGTSTGALIAAAVAAGIPARQVLDLYVTRARGLFATYPWSLPQRVLLGYLYSTRTLHDLITDELGAARGWTLNDAPIDLLITAKRVADGMPWYFVRDNPRNARRTGRLALADCATASAAAPTYFQPWTVPEDTATLPRGAEPVGTLVDGSVGVAGNPAYQACVEAFDYAEGSSPRAPPWSRSARVATRRGVRRRGSAPGYDGCWTSCCARLASNRRNSCDGTTQSSPSTASTRSCGATSRWTTQAASTSCAASVKTWRRVSIGMRSSQGPVPPSRSRTATRCGKRIVRACSARRAPTRSAGGPSGPVPGARGV